MNSEDPIVHDTLDTDEEGFVTGSAYTRKKGGYDVQAGVYSYEYERHGDARMNHVPNVIVVHPDGHIVAEPHANDSPHAGRAIDNAKDTVRFVFSNLDQYTD